MAIITIRIGKATVIVDSVETAADLLQRVGAIPLHVPSVRPAQCMCPNSWNGILPPPCPVHNPPQGSVTTSSTPNTASPCGEYVKAIPVQHGD